MTDQTETVEVKQAPVETPQAAPETEATEDVFDKERAMLTINKLRDEIKALKPAAKKAQELEALEKQRQEAALSEIDKIKKQLAESEAARVSLERAKWQNEAATKAKIPAEFATRLKGETPEELEADAQALAKALPKATVTTLQPTNPGANASGSGETDEQRRRRLLG